MALPSSPPRHPYPAQSPSAKLVVPDVRSLSFTQARAALVRAGLGAFPCTWRRTTSLAVSYSGPSRRLTSS